MSDFSHIPAIILAGGLGTRLRKVVSDRPKVMADLNGKPFLYYLLDQLADAGIKQVVISTGHMALIIEETIGSSYKGLEVDYCREETPLGTAGALKLAGEVMDSPRCLVMNGDSFVKFDPFSLFMFHRRKGANTTILLRKVEDTTRYGTVEIGAEHEVVRFREKGSSAGPGLMNAGVYFVEIGVLERIPDKTPYSLEYDFFPVITGHGLYGCETKGRFIDIGTPESYAKAEKFFECKPVSA
jgi:NDP-sugar pyrophosphorylase family protein